MPYSCDIDPRQRRGTVTLDGTVTSAEFVGALQALYGAPAWEPDFSALWDGTRIGELVLSPGDIQPIAAQYRRVQERMGLGRAAFVVPHDVAYTIARLLLHHMPHPTRERRVFERMGEAVAWLEGS